MNLAQFVRFAVTVVGMAGAGACFILIGSAWGWLAAIAVLMTSGVVADFAFRRLASPATIRDDLEDRVRNPD